MPGDWVWGTDGERAATHAHRAGTTAQVKGCGRPETPPSGHLGLSWTTQRLLPAIKRISKRGLLGSAPALARRRRGIVGLPNNIEPRLLLVDRDCSKRRLRTTVFRNREIAIEAVGSVREAVGVLTLQRFDLILLAARPDQVPGICIQLRKIAPRQRIALLVGPPDYL